MWLSRHTLIALSIIFFWLEISIEHSCALFLIHIQSSGLFKTYMNLESKKTCLLGSRIVSLLLMAEIFLLWYQWQVWVFQQTLKLEKQYGLAVPDPINVQAMYGIGGVLRPLSDESILRCLLTTDALFLVTYLQRPWLHSTRPRVQFQTFFQECVGDWSFPTIIPLCTTCI